jgi:hypothetical protein
VLELPPRDEVGAGEVGADDEHDRPGDGEEEVVVVAGAVVLRLVGHGVDRLEDGGVGERGEIPEGERAEQDADREDERREQEPVGAHPIPEAVTQSLLALLGHAGESKAALLSSL